MWLPSDSSPVRRKQSRPVDPRPFQRSGAERGLLIRALQSRIQAPSARPEVRLSVLGGISKSHAELS